MTHDQIDRMVRQANPVPDLKALEPVDASVLVLDQPRRTDMQTHDRIEVDQEQEQPRRGILVGMAAVAAAVIGFIALFQPLDDAPVAAGPSTPVEIATAFVEAYASFDVDRAASYLTADALSRSWGDLETVRLQLEFFEALGFKLLVDSCLAQGNAAPATTVRCAYDYHALRSDEIGLGPFGGNWFEFGIENGQIVSVADNLEFISNGFSAQMWEPFAAWLAATHPEDVAVMYTDSSQTMEQHTAESIALWEQRSREYAEQGAP